MRDAQRQRVYDAENKARRLLTDAGFEWRNVATEARYRRRLDEIMASKWMADTYPEAARRPVDLIWGSKRLGACAGAGGISTSVTDFALHELVLVHELAHTIEKRLTGVYDPGHGRAYCQIYLKLVRRFIGQRAHDELKAQFKAHGVKYLPKRESTVKRELPPALAAFAEKKRDEAARKFAAQLRAPLLPIVEKLKGRCVVAKAQRTREGTVLFDNCRFGAGRRTDELDIDMADRDLYAAWKDFLKMVQA